MDSRLKATRKALSKGVGSAKLRFEVFTRDGFRCRYCGAQPPVQLEIDHVQAVAAGGKDELANYVTACVECNRGKGKKSAAPPPLAATASSAGDKARIAALVEASKLPDAIASEILAELIVSNQFVVQQVKSKGRDVSNDQVKALAAISRAIQRALESMGLVPRVAGGDDEEPEPLPIPTGTPIPNGAAPPAKRAASKKPKSMLDALLD